MIYIANTKKAFYKIYGDDGVFYYERTSNVSERTVKHRIEHFTSWEGFKRYIYRFIEAEGLIYHKEGTDIPNIEDTGYMNIISYEEFIKENEMRL